MAEDEIIVWQDVLDSIAAGRSQDLTCPYCKTKPMVVEEVEYSTRVSCPKCKKFIQGRFDPQY